MNRKDRSLLVGMVLGDSHIKTASSVDRLAGRHPAAQICLGHSTKQKVYAQHKLDILNKMFKGNATLRFGTTSDPSGKKHGMCYANKSNPYFKTLKGMMYRDGVKTITRRVLDMLTPQGIAIWFMDDGSCRLEHREDGSVSSGSVSIATCCSLDEVNAIVNFFRENYGIEFKKAFDKRRSTGKEWSIRANTGESRKLAKLIDKHVIESMRYKIKNVHGSSRQECQAPVKQCVSCQKMVGHLTARGYCKACYNNLMTENRTKTDRTCDVCKETKNAKWFVGTRCRVCYLRIKRAMI